jgi:formylglycine-generating enzyme required for sulfatase activity
MNAFRISAALFFLSVSAVFAAQAPEETLLYFSPFPAKPEQVRTGRDNVQWRLNGQLFDEGPCLPNVPFPVLVGTPEQIQGINQKFSTAVKTFGPVRGYDDVFPKSSPALSVDPKAAINITNAYHNEEDVAALLTQFESNFPALAKKIQIGTTHWGRPIWALKISDHVATEEPEPRVLIDANIHAREYAPTEVALDVIWQLLYGYTNNATFASWVDGLEIYVIPCLNPDGRYDCRTVNTSWRKNGRDNNRSGTMTYPTDGVDLNRNSSFFWGSDNDGSSPTASNDSYRGPSPASEPETQAYDALIQRLRPGFTLSMHSYWGLFYGPYGDFNVAMPAPDPFKSLGTNIARVCSNEDNTACTYVSGPEFIDIPNGYTVNGDRTDANYGLYGIHAVGVELGSDAAGFQPAYATTRDKIVPWVRLGWQKLLAAAHTNSPKVRGWSLDAATGQPAAVRIHSLNLTNRPNDEHWTSRADGFFECPLPTAGTYRIVFSPLGQASLATTQTFAVATTAKETNLIFATAPLLGIPSTNEILVWSNQNENGTALIESTSLPEGPWLPLLSFACLGRTGQAQLPASSTTRYIRVKSSPRIFPANSNLVCVPSGHFQMGADGSADTNERPAAATFVDAFAIDAREVSFSNWTRVRIWATNNGYSFAAGQRGSGGATSASNHPVVMVTWYDAAKWCNARSQYEGLLPAYYVTAGKTNIYKTGTVEITSACVNWTGNGYRLPTEAEWEKSARGGFTGQEYPWGNAIAASNAQYAAAGTANVANYPANGIGVHDAAGNASEWCWDWSGTYSDRISDNPTGPTSGTARIVRGGSWSNDAAGLRCAARASLIPVFSNTVVGVRCVRR